MWQQAASWLFAPCCMPAAGEAGGGVGGVGQNWIRAARFAILCVLQSIQYRSSFCLRFLVSAPLWQE